MKYPKIAPNFKQMLISSEIKTSYNSKKIELKSGPVVQGCSVKMVFLKIFNNSLKNICAGVKRVWYRHFLMNFEEISTTSVLQNICEGILA